MCSSAGKCLVRSDILTVAHQAAHEGTIPRFYFPRGGGVPADAHTLMQTKTDALFRMHPDGLTIPAVKELMKEVLSAQPHKPLDMLQFQTFWSLYISGAQHINNKSGCLG